MKFLIMSLFPTSCHFINVWSKYSLQKPVLKHPQSTFVPSVLAGCNQMRSRHLPVDHKAKHGLNHMFIDTTIRCTNATGHGGCTCRHFQKFRRNSCLLNYHNSGHFQTSCLLFKTQRFREWILFPSPIRRQRLALSIEPK
jgi:hypothetical protein